MEVAMMLPVETAEDWMCSVDWYLADGGLSTLGGNDDGHMQL